MIYLSGCISQTVLADVRPDVGLMIQPGMGNYSAATLPLQFRLWAGDNGRYARPDAWVDGDWLEWMAGLRRYRRNCLFMVAPDMVGDAIGTLSLSLPYLPTIRQLGFVPAFVSQDGARSALVPWDEFGYLFVGGTDAWKFSAGSLALIAEAKRRRKQVHMGRVNTERRMTACMGMECDTMDGTFLKIAPDTNWPRLCGYLDRANTGQRGMVA